MVMLLVGEDDQRARAYPQTIGGTRDERRTHCRRYQTWTNRAPCFAGVTYMQPCDVSATLIFCNSLRSLENFDRGASRSLPLRERAAQCRHCDDGVRGSWR